MCGGWQQVCQPSSVAVVAAAAASRISAALSCMLVPFSSKSSVTIAYPLALSTPFFPSRVFTLADCYFLLRHSAQCLCSTVVVHSCCSRSAAAVTVCQILLTSLLAFIADGAAGTCSSSGSTNNSNKWRTLMMINRRC